MKIVRGSGAIAGERRRIVLLEQGQYSGFVIAHIPHIEDAGGGRGKRFAGSAEAGQSFPDRA